MDWNLEVLDKDMRRVAILEKAFNISYTLERNKLSSLEFSLMYDDIKNKFCEPFMFIRLYENGEHVDMFRISPNSATNLIKDSTKKQMDYKCEHVLGTLLDKALFGWIEVGGTTVRTRAVIQWLLNQQHVRHWVLDEVDFNRQFHYGWENENLLSALFSIPRQFGEQFIFKFDTSVYPFKLSLKRLSENIKSYIRYDKNMQSIERTVDVGAICTRLYPLGYGEGINQLKIDSVNPTGQSYLDAPRDIINKYGLIEKIWSDRRYKDVESLYNTAKSKLESLQNPPVTYHIDAVEFYPLTKIPIDKFTVGDCVKVVDQELGIEFTTHIIKKSKRNIDKDYISATIDLSSSGNEKNSHLTDLMERSRINELYSQGAVNIVPYILTDNADSDFPAKLRFKIPNEAVFINKIELSFEADRFRSYSRATEAAEATTSGPSSITTSGAGGGTTQTSGSGGGVSTTSGSGGGVNTTSGAGGGNNYTSSAVTLTPQNVQSADGGGLGNANHNHGLREIIWHIDFDNKFVRTVDFVPSGAHIHPAHSHEVVLRDHQHDIHIRDHVHEIHIRDHTHQITIPNHTHNIQHTHVIPAHKHDIEHGIYEGLRASSYQVQVDGTIVSGLTQPRNDIDIVPFLRKDEEGRVVRGWHEIRIRPQGQAKITAMVMVQTFINSKGNITV